jgi:putative colanic acid biosynthesis UDP-glucose lipid carrier transferase
LLRLSNLDELPQFFNVLAGSMSLVGPRPHMHADCNAFAELIPGYKFRNLVKPGITGLAQVKGYHGPIVSQECITKRYEWDAWYVRHANWGLDIHIIWCTAWQTLLYLVRGKKPAVGRKQTAVNAMTHRPVGTGTGNRNPARPGQALEPVPAKQEITGNW